eukprot:NP_001033322.1 BTB and MATH domain containing [Caenorhabditis elegans]
MVVANKEFKLSHVFTNVLKMKDGDELYSPQEMHFNIPWMLKIKRNADHLGAYCYCLKLPKDEDGVAWTIDGHFELTALDPNGYRSLSGLPYLDCVFTNKRCSSGRAKFMSWNEMIEDYLINDSITIEVAAKITKMSGVIENLHRFFDKSMKQFSDVVIDVKGTKFYVLRKLLAFHSTYFYTLLGDSTESKVTISDINADDFQTLLEVLYGESAINDSNVDGLLQFALKHEILLAIQKCIEFLSEKSEKPMKDRVKIAKQHKLYNLKHALLMKIKTTDEIKAALSEDLLEMDTTVVAALLQKALKIK